MRAVYLNEKGGPENLLEGDLPTPTAGAGEVLVKVHATAVMPTELEWFPTFHKPSGEPRPFPIVLSHEFSGVVASVGAKVDQVKRGDEVYGINDWFNNGAQADYCVAQVGAFALKPKSLDHTRAAVVPISALTAWQGLFERCSVLSGQRVLIQGASGGVGTFAVQLARSRGAYVIATVSAANAEFVRSIGANEVIDYRSTPFEKTVGQVDVVFDGVGGETLERSWQVLKPGGKLVTIVSQNEQQISQRNRDAFLLVRSDRAQLGEIACMIDAGELRVFVEAVFPLSKSREAYARAQRGGMRGKIALQII